MNKQFAALILGDLLPNTNCLTLGFGLSSDAARVCAAHCPAVTVPYNVLVSCHNFTSFHPGGIRCSVTAKRLCARKS